MCPQVTRHAGVALVFPVIAGGGGQRAIRRTGHRVADVLDLLAMWGASTGAHGVVVSPPWVGLRAVDLEVYIVTGVRKETSADGTHRHITEVCTQGGIRHTRHEVVDRDRKSVV